MKINRFQVYGPCAGRPLKTSHSPKLKTKLGAWFLFADFCLTTSVPGPYAAPRLPVLKAAVAKTNYDFERYSPFVLIFARVSCFLPSTSSTVPVALTILGSSHMSLWKP